VGSAGFLIFCWGEPESFNAFQNEKLSYLHFFTGKLGKIQKQNDLIHIIEGKIHLSSCSILIKTEYEDDKLPK